MSNSALRRTRREDKDLVFNVYALPRHGRFQENLQSSLEKNLNKDTERPSSSY